MKRCILLAGYFISSFYFVGCRSFSKDLINAKPLTEKTLSQLNGRYEITAKDFDSLSQTNRKQIWIYNNFFTEIDRSLLRDTIKLDSLKTYHFELETVNPKKLKVKYIVQDTVFRSRLINTKLKKDGYLYLKNKNLKFLFLPYIAGAIDIKKCRLSASSDGNLIVDMMNHRSGAFLVIMMDGRTWKYRNEYVKVQ